MPAADTVVFCAILHEVYSYTEPPFQLDSVARVVRAAFEVLRPGGRIVIRDGVMPPPGTRRIRMLAPDVRPTLPGAAPRLELSDRHRAAVGLCEHHGMRAICLAAVLLTACSDDPQQLIDASTIDAAYDTARCLIAGHYGALGTKTGTAGNVQGSPTLTIVLDGGPPRDSFFLKLTMGKGVFTGGLANGTYALAGADLDFNNCGLCVNIIADIVSGVGPSKFYFADAGMVTLTNTSPPAGALANVSFREVSASGQVVSNGCTANIATMSFSM